MTPQRSPYVSIRWKQYVRDYDQRLYDALWRAHFKLSLDQSQSATFNFTFPRKDWKTKEISEVSLRVRVEAQKQVVLLSLLQDF